MYDEKKTIENFNCRKAKTNFGGRRWIAYYSTDISISDGPYKFAGLPGLILELYSEDNDYHFLMRSLKKISSCDNDILLGNNLKSRKEYIIFFRKYLKEPSSYTRINDLGNSMGFNYEIKINGKPITMEENYKRIDNFVLDFVKSHNNPIEKNDLWLK